MRRKKEEKNRRMRDKEIEERGRRMWGKKEGGKREQANNTHKQLNNAKSLIKPMSIDISINEKFLESRKMVVVREK